MMQASLSCYRHSQRETGVSCARCERLICSECMTPAAVGFHCPECIRKNRISRLTRSKRILKSQGPVTTILVGLNILVFVATIATGGSLIRIDRFDSFLYQNFALFRGPVAFATPGGYAIETGMSGGEYWRLFTSLFLHYGFAHIALNMWALWILGRELEKHYGIVKYLALYFISGLGGGVAIALWAGSNQVVVGASGSIFGLFGAIAVLTIKERRNPRSIGLIIAINLILSLAIPSISLLGHLGGLVIGSLIAIVTTYVPQSRIKNLLIFSSLSIITLLLLGLGAIGTFPGL